MLLCLVPPSVQGDPLIYTQVADASACAGYIAIPSGDFPYQTLTYPEANQLIGGAALLFVLAFIFRLVRKQLLGH